jgi:peptidyl-prolyl cis-trans isomerase SurA
MRSSVILRKRHWVAFAFAAVTLAVPAANASIVERVIAVVGERPVLWTELLHRAGVGRLQIRMQTHDPNVISVQEQEMYKELLDRMIDERLEEQQADRARISISPEEIDRGIANIATQAQQQQARTVSVADVLDEVRRRGMTEQEFRDEIRRQIVEGKLIELRVRPRVRVTDQDAHASYQHWVQDLKDREPVDVRILAIRIPASATKTQVEARSALAQELVQRARGGENFCDLVTQYSDDASTRETCGSRGPQPIATLMPAIQDALRVLKVGAVSDPIAVSTGQDQVLVILMPLGEAKVPAYEEVKDEMLQKALLDGLDRARKQWLKELRRNAYIDVRL